MRVKRFRTPSVETPGLDSNVSPAGAIRAVEPVFEQIAREAQVRALVFAHENDGGADSMAQWLARVGS